MSDPAGTPDATGPWTSPSPPPPRQLRLDHDLRVGDLLPVVLINTLLNIATLTFYRFWAKTRIRRMLWAGTRVEGDRLEYTGTGKELLIGFLIVVLVVLVPLAALNILVKIYVAQEDPILASAILSPLYLVFLYLFGVAIYRAQRYRLSRTRWRGIRPALPGSSWTYGFLHAAIYLLNGVTLGWSYPWGRMRLYRRMMSETEFGDRAFTCEGSAEALYPRFALCWFLSIPAVVLVFLFVVLISASAGVAADGGWLEKMAGVFGLLLFPLLVLALLVLALLLFPLLVLALLPLWAVYKKKEYEHLTACTGYEGLSFSLNMTYWGFVWLYVGNALILILTLTLGRAFAQQRLFRFGCRHLEIVGDIDFEAIRQSAAERPGSGEGLADAFDVASI